VPVAALITNASEQPGAPDGMAALQLFHGETLLERQVRQLIQVGVGHIVIHAETVPGTMVAAIDRLSKRGASIELTRTPADAAGRIHPEERVITLYGGLVLPSALIEQLARGAGNTIITVPDAADPQRFERIDAQDRWAGALVCDGGLVRETASIVGDWELAPTLLRRALQLGAVRYPLEAADGRFHRFMPLNGVELSEAIGVAPPAEAARAGLYYRHIAGPVGQRLARVSAQSGLSYRLFEISSIILFLLSFIVEMMIADWAGFLLFALSIIGIAIADIVRTAVLGPNDLWARLLDGRGIVLGALALLAVATGPDGLGLNLPTMLGIWFVVQWALVDQLRDRQTTDPVWRPDSGALALVLAVSGLIGVLSSGLALGIAALLAEQFWRQRRLPRS
jgi:hypothetical protein